MPRRVLLTTDVVGGVWDFCLTLARGLRDAGDDVVLLALGSPTATHQTAACQIGARLRSVPLKLEWMNDAAADVRATPAAVRQIAQQVGADIVHANQFAAACADVDVPVVLTLHSDVLSWRRWTLGDSTVPSEWQPYTELVREAVTRADSVVAVSHFLADQMTDLYSLHRPIGVIHNGWPAPTPATAHRDRLTVVAGRIWDAAKNVALVAEAAQGWQCGAVYLAGETDHPDGGRARVPLPLQAVGFLPRTELDVLLDRAKVYISAARYDPFGLLPLQAALHGCQLLLSDIPSYREVWGETVTYFRSDDASDLRERWQKLLEAPSTTAALMSARERLSVERMVESYRALYANTPRAVAA
jgi:glycogen(starch) synthase